MENKFHSIDYIKRQAKKLKKEENISHSKALDLVAVKLGYSNWMHCQRSIKENQVQIPNYANIN